MSLGDRLASLRKQNNYTQEQLAQILGVSRQAVSKWESDTAYPETEKLLRLSKLYGCSLEELLDEKATLSHKEEGLGKFIKEKQSEKTWRGLPLWQVAKNAKAVVAVGWNAKGIIAVGFKAQGVLSFGLFSMGVFSFGLLSLGLVAMGMLGVGLLAAGSIALGIFAFGSIALGILSFGAIAVGEFSVGALAIGKYFAYGDNARAMIAVGYSFARGVNAWAGGTAPIDALVQAWDSVVPAYFSWLKFLLYLVN